MAAPNFGDVIASTWHRQTPKPKDSIADNNMLFKRLRDKGRSNTVDGGRELRETVSYPGNGTFSWHSGYQPVSVAPSQTIDAATYTPKQASIATAISSREKLMNRGRQQIVSLMKTRMMNAEKEFENKMGEALYGDGTGYGGLQIGGLAQLLPVDPTAGVAGGIPRASQTWWRNLALDQTSTDTNIEEQFNTLWSMICRGADKPDLIVVDNIIWRRFVANLQAKQRFVTNTDKAVKGFTATKYMSADVVLDGGYGGNCPDNRAYFINTDYLQLQSYEGADIEPAPGGSRTPVDQHAEVSFLVFMGALTMSAGARHGTLDGS